MQTKPLEILRKRVDFLACNRGRRQPMPGFVLLVRDRKDDNPAIRIGITVTKKIGGAVVRNRMKRRFRVLARALLPAHGIAGADHVLIGREGGIERDFALLHAELGKALGKIMTRPVDPPRGPARRSLPISIKNTSSACQTSAGSYIKHSTRA